MPAAYLPPQPRPDRILSPMPPPWWPLALMGVLLTLAGLGTALLYLTN